MLLELMHQVPLWLTTIIVTLIAEIYSVGLMLLSRYLFGVSRLSLNNEVAGFKFAVVGVFYAVLLAFVVIAVWEEYHETESHVRAEAKATVDMYRAGRALPAEGSGQIREDLLKYVEAVRKDEWPAMALGKSSEVAANDLARLSAAIFDVQPQDQREAAVYHHAIDLLMVLTDNRNERLDSSTGSVPKVLWFVLIVGGAITLGYPAFFASSNLVAQILMTGGSGGSGRLVLATQPRLRFPLHRRCAHLPTSV